jgi:hypothetical protein
VGRLFKTFSSNLPSVCPLPHPGRIKESDLVKVKQPLKQRQGLHPDLLFPGSDQLRERSNIIQFTWSVPVEQQEDRREGATRHIEGQSSRG